MPDHPVFDRQGLQGRVNTLQHIVDEIKGLDLVAIMNADGAEPDQNLKGFQNDMRLMLVASLNVFAKVVATRYLLSGTPANEVLDKAWDDIGDSFTLHAKRRGKEQ